MPTATANPNPNPNAKTALEESARARVAAIRDATVEFRVPAHRGFWARGFIRTALPMDLSAEEALFEWSREHTEGTRPLEWLCALELRFDRLKAQEETGKPAEPVFVESPESDEEFRERRAKNHTASLTRYSRADFRRTGLNLTRTRNRTSEVSPLVALPPSALSV